MIDSYFRKPYQSLLVDPLLALYPPIKKVSPKTLTVCGCIFGIMVVPLLAYNWAPLALVCILLSGYFDTLDGTIARLGGQTSPQGAVLDIFCDRIVEFSIILGLYLADPGVRGLLSLMMLGSTLVCVTSFLTVGIFTENVSEKSFHYSPGLIERGEAFLLFIAMILLPSSFSVLALIFASLVTLTAVIRIYEFSYKDLALGDMQSHD